MGTPSDPPEAAEPTAGDEARYALFDNAPVALWEIDLTALPVWVASLRERGVANVVAYLATDPEALEECMSQVTLKTVNRAALVMAGAESPEQMRGPLHNLIGKESAAIFHEMAIALFEGRRHVQVEAPARSIPGDPFDVQVTMSLPDQHEAWDSVVLSFVDITLRRRHERILRELAEGVSGVVGEPFLRTTVSAFARSLGASHAFIGELVEGEDESVQTLALSVHGELADNIRYALEGTPCAGVVRQQMCVIEAGVQALFPDDHLLVEMGVEGYAAVPLRDSRGEVLGLMAVLFDAPITDSAVVESALTIFAARASAELERVRGEQLRDALQLRLSQAQKMESVGRLAGGIAHDFNNLLTPILGATELARQRAGGDKGMAADLDQISDAANRAAQLTRQLLAFSRRQHLSLQLLDLNRVVSDFAGMLRRIVRENVRIVTELNAPPAGVRGDRSQIEQILMNLAVNAQDAMPDGGTLTIRTAGRHVGSDIEGVRPGAYATLSVVDTGTGIPPELLPHIFEPFFTTKSADKGTGLGLATVYGVATQHGGTVRVDSAEGVGSSFEILLPIEGRTGTAHSDVVVDEPLPTGTERILVVEDDDAVRALTRRMLQELGYHVVPAASPEVALSIARTIGSELDLLLTDVVMPGMSGVELHRRLRDEGIECRVLYMSGYAPEMLLKHASPAERVELMEKPFTMLDLARRVRSALGS